MLKLSQLRVSIRRLGEDNAVVQPSGLTLPELHQERLDDVAAPVNADRITRLYLQAETLHLMTKSWSSPVVGFGHLGVFVLLLHLCVLLDQILKQQSRHLKR